jgi:hypothetical protein
MATPSVFFGVSNYHSERWDRRQIFNRQAITGVNTVPLHLLQIQGTVTAHTGALLTQWNRLGTPSGGHTDCGPVFRIWTALYYKAAIRHRPDCVRLLFLILGYYATSLCLLTKFSHKESKLFNTYQICVFYTTNEMQLLQCSLLLSALYMFRAVFPHIIRRGGTEFQPIHTSGRQQESMTILKTAHTVL